MFRQIAQRIGAALHISGNSSRQDELPDTKTSRLNAHPALSEKVTWLPDIHMSHSVLFDPAMYRQVLGIQLMHLHTIANSNSPIIFAESAKSHISKEHLKTRPDAIPFTASVKEAFKSGIPNSIDSLTEAQTELLQTHVHMVALCLGLAEEVRPIGNEVGNHIADLAFKVFTAKFHQNAVEAFRHPEMRYLILDYRSTLITDAIKALSSSDLSGNHDLVLIYGGAHSELLTPTIAGSIKFDVPESYLAVQKHAEANSGVEDIKDLLAADRLIPVSERHAQAMRYLDAAIENL